VFVGEQFSPYFGLLALLGLRQVCHVLAAPDGVAAVKDALDPLCVSWDTPPPFLSIKRPAIASARQNVRERY
jgi:hypothetical protein